MAGSNWDTFVVNERGLPVEPIFESRLGVQVELYKNWIYVHDAKGWRDGGALAAPVIMQIDHGKLEYLDVQIEAVRGPKDGVYVAVHGTTPGSFDAMIGIGCYGYAETGRWVGVQRAEVDYLKDFLSRALPDLSIDFAPALRLKSEEI